MEETHVALGVVCRNACRGPYVCEEGVDHLSQTNLQELLTIPGFFCGREAEVAFPESQEQVCSSLDRSKRSCLESSHKSGTVPQDKAAWPCCSRG